MFHRPVFRSQLALLIAVTVAIQSVGMGFAAQCGGAVSCCAASEGDSQSCCHQSNTDECCCGSSQETRCSTLCSCDVHGPKPATPYESQSSDGLQQLLAYGSSQPTIQFTVSVNKHHYVVKPAALPAAKAGVNAILCVWLT